MVWSSDAQTAEEIAEEIPSMLAATIEGKSYESLIPIQTFLKKLGKSALRNMAYNGKRIKIGKNDNVLTTLLGLSKENEWPLISLKKFLYPYFVEEGQKIEDLAESGPQKELLEKIRLRPKGYFNDKDIYSLGKSYAVILEQNYPEFTQVKNRRLSFSADKYKKFVGKHFKGFMRAARGWKNIVSEKVKDMKASMEDRNDGKKYIGVNGKKHPCYETEQGKFYYTTDNNDSMEKVVFVPKNTPNKKIGIAFSNYDFDMSTNSGKFEGFIIDTCRGFKRMQFSFEKEDMVKSGLRLTQNKFEAKEGNIINAAKIIGEAVLDKRAKRARIGPKAPDTTKSAVR